MKMGHLLFVRQFIVFLSEVDKVQIYEMHHHSIFRVYPSETSWSIRCLAWYPTICVLILGCRNGDLIKLELHDTIVVSLIQFLTRTNWYEALLG